MNTTLRPSRGDVRPDGFVFRKMQTNGEQSWLSPRAWHHDHVRSAFYAARARAAKKGVPCGITTQYLLSIFPNDNVCPVLGSEMRWGGDSLTSPSLDRVIPELGYVPGNVMWISGRANTLKGMNTLDTLKRLVSFYEDRLKGLH